MPDAQKLQRVFVVDDEPVIASTLTMILCMHGFEATSFTLPREALLATRTENPDLLISDVVMPQLSGIELAIQVRANCPNCKILLFSGQSNRADGPGSNGQGFEVLSKPIHPAELLRKVKELTEAAARILQPARLRTGMCLRFARRSGPKGNSPVALAWVRVLPVCT